MVRRVLDLAEDAWGLCSNTHRRSVGAPFPSLACCQQQLEFPRAHTAWSDADITRVTCDACVSFQLQVLCAPATVKLLSLGGETFVWLFCSPLCASFAVCMLLLPTNSATLQTAQETLMIGISD